MCQWSQRNSAVLVINQGPLRGANIAQPIMLHQTLLLPRAYKRRSGRFSRLTESFRFNQKQLAFPQFQERFAAVVDWRIGSA